MRGAAGAGHVNIQVYRPHPPPPPPHHICKSVHELAIISMQQQYCYKTWFKILIISPLPPHQKKGQGAI